jgi:hypothetical protein
MKRSKAITLGALFVAGISACTSNTANWITGYDAQNPKRDTMANGVGYRYYGGGWYPIYNGMICPGYYNRGYTITEINTGSFVPARAEASSKGSMPGTVAEGVTTGGFGESAGAGDGGAGE